MAVNNLSRLSSDGTCYGQNINDKISFYGVTTVIQPTSATQAAVTTGATTTATINLVNELRGALVTLGLIKGS